MMAVPRAGEIDVSSDHPGDRALIDHVHPPNWKNPAGRDNDNLVVLGGGTAGLVCAIHVGVSRAVLDDETDFERYSRWTR
ncbi:MAG TPA: hypothetical protein VNJ02_14880 [Vicinamibacterales bacterium]|nr:hypothetical protein [Vicinamibacterales bacterium]